MDRSPADAPATASNPSPTTDRSSSAFAWVVGAVVLGVLALAAVVVVVAGVIIMRTEPETLGGPAGPVSTADPFEAARRCRAEQPVSMQIDYDAPAPTIEAAELTAKDQVGEAYGVQTWQRVEATADGSWWAGFAADAEVVAVFDIERSGSGWAVGDIRRC